LFQKEIRRRQPSIGVTEAAIRPEAPYTQKERMDENKTKIESSPF
jgi:hypothetical protein